MQSTAITEVARDRRHRKMGWLGMSRCNSFGILVDGQGEGVAGSGDRGIARDLVIGKS
jgi:hypothetical protein